MNIREELQTKLNALTAAYDAEKAPIEAALKSGESWLEREYESVVSEIQALIAKVRGTPAQAAMQNPLPPTPPTA